MPQGPARRVQDTQWASLHPMAMSECQRGFECHKEQIKALIHQEDIPGKGGVPAITVTEVWVCPSHGYSKPDETTALDFWDAASQQHCPGGPALLLGPVVQDLQPTASHYNRALLLPPSSSNAMVNL